MSTAEFDLIAAYFSDCGQNREDVELGVGDDAALLQLPPGQQLLITQDTLVDSVHFFSNTDPAGLGHKALAVNLSDLAAMGAQPAWVTLGLTLPEVDRHWLSGFARGFCDLARQQGVRLIGGDTCRGPLSLSICAQGLVPQGQALRRDGARPGDLIYVTGSLGDAGLAVRHLRDGLELVDPASAIRRLERPQPRVAAGLALRGLASAAIDVSDGLLADLGHILQRSGVGAGIRLADLPCSDQVQAHVAATQDWSAPLSGGDDYELCFTLPPAQAQRLADFPCPVSCIGEIESQPGMRIIKPDGSQLQPVAPGYQHFSGHG